MIKHVKQFISFLIIIILTDISLSVHSIMKNEALVKNLDMTKMSTN